MNGLLKKGSIAIVLGPGGVGKTTVAAALGLAAARQGLETGLITVDPARRLRDALGIERLSREPRRLDARRLRAAGLSSSLRLSVMTLDVKRTWDGLVEQFVKSPAARRRIRENVFYQGLTQQFAGAEVYAALEQLYDLRSAGRFEIAVVDTPPAAHAFEFFEAPAHLMRLLDSNTVRWLFRPPAHNGGSALTLASRAVNFVVSQLESFAGSGMLTAMAEFFAVAGEAAALLRERFRRAHTMLRSANVNFLVVTTPREDRFEAALQLAARAQSQRFHLRGVVLNRMLDERTFIALQRRPVRVPEHLTAISRLGADGAGDARLAALIRYLEAYEANQRAELAQARRFAHQLAPHMMLTLVPEVEMGVRDLRALAKLASILSGAAAGRRFLDQSAAALGPVPRGRSAPS